MADLNSLLAEALEIATRALRISIEHGKSMQLKAELLELDVASYKAKGTLTKGDQDHVNDANHYMTYSTILTTPAAKKTPRRKRPTKARGKAR